MPQEQDSFTLPGGKTLEELLAEYKKAHSKQAEWPLPEPVPGLIGQSNQDQFSTFINGLLNFLNVNADQLQPEASLPPLTAQPQEKMRVKRFNEEFEGID